MLKLKEMAKKAKEAEINIDKIAEEYLEKDRIAFLEEDHANEYMKGGRDMIDVRCGKCGHIETYDRDIYRKGTSCKACGKELQKWPSECKIFWHVCAVPLLFDKEGFAVAMYSFYTNYSMGREGNLTKRVSNLNCSQRSGELEGIIAYSKKYGSCLYNSELNRMSNISVTRHVQDIDLLINSDIVKEINASFPVNITEDMGIWALVEEMNDLPYEDATIKAAKKAIATSKKEAEINEIKSFKKDFTKEEIKVILRNNRNGGIQFTEEYSTTPDGESIYAYGCGHCGCVHTTTEAKPDKVYCPECGENFTHSSFYESTKIIYIADWGLTKDKCLVLTQYKVKIENAGSFKDCVKRGKINTTVTYCDIERQVKFTGKASKPVIWTEGTLEKYGYTYNDYTLTSLKDVVQDSVFKYYNVEAVEKELQKNDRDIGSVVRYIQYATQCPFLIGMISRGMYEAVEEIMDNLTDRPSDCTHWKGKKDVREALGISKTVLKQASKYNLGLNEIFSLRNLMKEDSSLSYECFDWFNTTVSKHSLSRLPWMLRKINENVIKPIHFEDIRKYLKSLYYNQCIDYDASIEIWDDYISMMKRLSFKPAAYKQKLFPQSLKKEHDILVFASKNISMKEHEEAFKDTIESGKRLEYAYGDLIVRMPQSVEEIVEEGVHLHHSVAQHIERVALKEEYIAFIREKDTPDVPYYTVEVLREGRGKIVQVRSFSNLPANDRIKAFLEKWASYKKLTIKSL